ncbi:MAG: penicillin-binding protein 2 [Candidatus Adiutrix sp.]|jgi:penicillin-binding protein 2|nr:penicillin-binding protein 2 [Candidatus Adiutrix sp.]
MDKHHQPFADQGDGSGARYYLLFWGMVFFFMILGVRLWYLQVIKGDELRNKSEVNRSSLVDLPPVRGQIMDRNGLVLVDNWAGFNVCLTKKEVGDAPALLAELALLTGRSYEALLARYQADPQAPQVCPIVSNLSREELVAVESRRWRLDGLRVEVSTRRLPLSDVLASHLLGYMGEIGKTQLDNERRRLEEEARRLVLEGETREEALARLEYELKPHRAGELIGQSGVEQSMERQLQGRRGYAVREVDSRGRLLRELKVVQPESGYNIRLTIDSRLQAMGQHLLGDRAGAIVVLNPDNFEILALASSPTYSLSDFAGGISSARWKSLVEDKFTPMLNRAVSGQYPPGSTFKVVVALAALAEGIITPDTVFHCNGSLKLGNHTFHCHNRFGHGPVDLRKSLKVSCDVYYYEVGRRMGVDRLAKRAREFFGLGRRMGVDLLAESAGNIPDSEWKLRERQQQWRPGETLPVAIGQGQVNCTPLQVAQFTAVLANGGTLYRPHLVKEILDVDGTVAKSFEPEFISKIEAPSAYLEAIKDGLEAVVGEPGGSGRRAALPGLRISGKTGTSQVVSLRQYQSYAKGKIPYARRDHAWFTAYAPSDKPEVVVTVLLEHTGGGGVYAAPVARQMLEAYFDESITAPTLPPPQAQPDQATSWGLVEGD